MFDQTVLTKLKLNVKANGADQAQGHGCADGRLRADLCLEYQVWVDCGFLKMTLIWLATMNEEDG
jgi:hypothetical protein